MTLAGGSTTDNLYTLHVTEGRGGAVEELHYKPEGRGFDSRWCHLNFPLT
jgi:hypothetical protein